MRCKRNQTRDRRSLTRQIRGERCRTGSSGGHQACTHRARSQKLPAAAKAALLVECFSLSKQRQSMTPPAAASPRDSAMLRTSQSFSLLNQIVHLGLVLGLAARARRVFHHARGLGLAYTFARVGFHRLGCGKPPWLAFRHSIPRTGFAFSRPLAFPGGKDEYGIDSARGEEQAGVEPLRRFRKRGMPMRVRGHRSRRFALTLDRCCGDAVFLKR